MKSRSSRWTLHTTYFKVFGFKLANPPCDILFLNLHWCLVFFGSLFNLLCTSEHFSLICKYYSIPTSKMGTVVPYAGHYWKIGRHLHSWDLYAPNPIISASVENEVSIFLTQRDGVKNMNIAFYYWQKYFKVTFIISNLLKVQTQ